MPWTLQDDAYNLVKFYTLERSLVWSILAATFTEKLEFPFLPDETEHLIITLAERRSVLLIGRSGTGKTTIARAMGKMLYRLGVLSTDATEEVSALDLQGSYVGQTKDKLNDVF